MILIVCRVKLAGTELPLVCTCNLYVTMTPGFGSDWRLPDNLSALLRPVALIRPDSLLIISLFLYNYGFKFHHELAQKVLSFVKICMDFQVFTVIFLFLQVNTDTLAVLIWRNHNTPNFDLIALEQIHIKILYSNILYNFCEYRFNVYSYKIFHFFLTLGTNIIIST